MPTILSVWAHPDDEAFGPVGLVHAARAAGWRTALITATRGEAGAPGADGHGADGLGMAKPRRVNPSPAAIAARRVVELKASCAIIGIERVDIWEYPDGGLRDVDTKLLRDRVLAVLEEERPHIVLTFGPDGIYGHPDHIAIHVATMQAFAQYVACHTAAEPPRLYYSTVNPAGERPVNPAGDAEAPPPLPPTAIIDASAYAEVKRRALAAHASQRGDWQPRIANQDWLNNIYLHRAYPPVAGNESIETNIFA